MRTHPFVLSLARRKWPALALACLLLAPMNVAGQETSEDMAARMKALEERVRQLEALLEALQSALPGAPAPAPAAAPAAPGAPPETQVPAGAAGAGGPSGRLPVYGGSAALSKVFNPDISIIGDFLGAVGRDPVNPVPVLEMHESELGLQAIIDPYARGDFFLSFGEEGVDLEEGYITFTSLPAGLLAKAGKMRSVFGKVNTLHNHNLPWVDRPLMTDNLVGGEEGITDAGLSLSRLLPAPKDIFLEITGQVFRGDAAGGTFRASQRSDVSLVGHLRGYHDLSESTNLDLGFSYARGHNDQGGSFVTQLHGLDATVRWKPLRGRPYRSFISRTELTWSRRQQPLLTQRAFGYFTSLEYQLARRWFVGGRYDWSERDRNAAEHDSGGSVLLTFWP
ncbi:MAG: hypothetical protein ACE5HB_10010, partial [Terriglobia bacterium]